MRDSRGSTRVFSLQSRVVASTGDQKGVSSVGRTVLRYAVAVLAVGVAIGLRLSLDPLLGTRFPFALLLLAVLWVSAHRGTGPALLATVVGAVAGVRFLVPPRRSFVPDGPDHLAVVGMYVAVAFVMVYLANVMQGQRLRAEGLAARALKDAEQLRITLTSIGDGVIVTDARGRVTSMNPVAEALTGVKAAQAEGRPLDEVFRVVDEETREPVRSPVEKVLADGQTAGLANHTVLVAQDGQELFIDDSAAAIRGGSGEIVGAVLVFREIGERRRSEEAQRRLASIVENSEDAIIGKSLDGVITSWNAGAERLYGYRAAEVIGKPSAFLTPDDRIGERSAILVKLKEQGVAESLETVRRAKDGRLIDVSMSMAPIRDARGKIIGSSTIARDITPRKRAAERIRKAEEARQESQHIYRAIGESIDYGVWVCAPDGRNVYASDSFLNLVGLTQEECSAFGWEKVLHPDDARRTMEAWKECVRTEGRWDVEHRFKGRDGNWHPILARGGPVRNERGEIVAWAGINLDISSLKRAEERLREADRNKNDFLAVLAHELRNPLAPLLNALVILKRPDADAAVLTEARDMAERQVHHLARLVDDLLDVSRITHGKIELRKERMELSTAVARAVETALPAIEGQGHELTVTLPPKPVWLKGDTVRIAQVLANLLNNSAKYTAPRGSISLEVEETGGEAVVRVRDTGMGIPEAALPRVFEMFAQAAPADSRSPMSLGVGLRLVKSLVELHGGSVEARSAGLGKGSEFVVRLPTAAPAEPPAAHVVEAPPPTSPRHVLVVDDNADAAASLAVLLRLEGHDARVAHSGPSALEMVERSLPDVVFLDIGMPGMDGYEVARRLRAQHGAAGLKLVALTGWGQEHDRQRARDAGFDHHLTKPVAPNDLQPLLSADTPS
jgi:PAS domain S-box-containing protein